MRVLNYSCVRWFVLSQRVIKVAAAVEKRGERVRDAGYEFRGRKKGRENGWSGTIVKFKD